jgi:hypothetical protein
MINRRMLLFKKTSHFFQNFSHRNIFFSDKRLFGCVPDLAIDAVVGANFVGTRSIPSDLPNRLEGTGP